jgi:YidC/Oxa1 family membrane protein insertase
MQIFDIFIPLLIQPLVNVMVVMYALLGHNFVFALLASTILVQLITWPLTMQSMSSSKKMQALQNSPEWKDAQKKYKNDREKMSQVTMELYRKHGINPAAGCLPTLIQFPLLIAFYQAINVLLAVNPETLLDMTRYLYHNIPFIADIAKQTVPLQSTFLWLNLAHPDPYYVMPVLVAASTWLSQRTMSMPSGDTQQAAINNQMQLMMPVMIGWFALQVASGLSIYWIISSLVRMAIQGFTQGWGNVLPSGFKLPAGIKLPGRLSAARPAPRKIAEPISPSSADVQVKPETPPRKSDQAASSNNGAKGSGKRRARRQARR